MKRVAFIIVLLLGITIESGAVLKEKNLEETLTILRSELTKHYVELNSMRDERKEQRQEVFRNLTQTMKLSNQNALMLYSQNQEYLFDLTYACHQATEQYQQFQRQQTPFREFISKTSSEVARYDSLIQSLQSMHITMLSQKAKTDRTVCLTLATVIKRTLENDSRQMEDYIRYYDTTESRLKNMNDYAQKRYYDIQTSIFVNGGETYFNIVRNFKEKWRTMKEVVSKKYTIDEEIQRSDWNIYWIIGLFIAILFYAFIAIGINLLVFRFMPKRFHSREFLKKRSSIMWATTTITLALLMGVMRHQVDQNFFIMASGLMVEYLWLLAVILISLLLRLKGNQIRSAFNIYAPLLVIGFIVITFRIILIPSELVSIFFPPVLLACMIWQWWGVKKHNRNIPRSDMFYTYISLTVFIVSVCFSWTGYTLLAVQLLIWWIMQLTCILTITCISDYLKMYEEKLGFAAKPITQTWFYTFIHQVVMPVLIVCSVMISIYWAADVFNLSDTTWKLFRTKFIDSKNFVLSIFSISQVATLWFLFSYINRTIQALFRLHFEKTDKASAASRQVMIRNVINLLVWGSWILICLNMMHVDNTWLVVVSGGLSTGIGFAMKDIIENIYYGISLMAGRVRVGDYIICDGTRGRVSSINYTSTMIEAIDGSVIAFQNSQLFTKNYKNMTKNHGYELDILEVGVAYGTDIEKCRKLLVDAISKLPFLERGKQVKIVLKSFDDSCITLKILVWVPVFTQYADDGKVLECVYKTLNENNIVIPFPQRDVHIITSEG